MINSMKCLKTAVIGLGRIGWNLHIPQILRRKDMFTLVGVVDVSQERLDEAKQVYGVNGYTDIATLVEKEKPDLVVIASPTHLHREHACTALKLGCDVFCDKPLSTDYENACAIAQCAEECGRKLMVYQPHRAGATANHIKAILATGKLGKLSTIKCNISTYVRRSDWQAFKKFGGGMLNNYGAHHIDELLYITGDRVKQVRCLKNCVITAGDADDVVKVLFKTENNVILDMDIDQASALQDLPWMVCGSTGAMLYKKDADGKEYFHLRYYDPAAVPEITASEALAAANRSYNNDVAIPWVEEDIPLDPSCAIDFYNQVYAYFGLDEAPFVPIGDTLEVMRLLQLCHENAEQE